MPSPSCACGSPPSQWVQGESVDWQMGAASYPPADGWTMVGVLRSAGGFPLNITSTVSADGQSYLFHLSPAQTSAMPPGPVGWQFFAEQGPTRRAVSGGRSLVCADIASASNFDPRSPAERMYDALMAIGPEVMASGYASMSVDGVTVEFRGLDEYRRALDAARAAVMRQQNEGGDPCLGGANACGAGRASGRGLIKVVFSPP